MPEPKRQKIDDFQLNLQETAALHQKYQNSLPYKHAVVDDLFSPSLLRKVYHEINQLQFTRKETDIYKINQTGDLANIDGLEGEEKEALKSLNQLKQALYSSEFKTFVQEVTGCGEMSMVQDLSINKYSPGCHLLNHDDVIGSRLVSYILYLPDEEVCSNGGGKLELYPVLEAGIPDVAPSVIIEPKWNRMVFFTVQPGYSFHSVEEVLKGDRVSISGWFHVPVEGQTAIEKPLDYSRGVSTLEQILLGDNDCFNPYGCQDNFSESETLTKADIDYLSRFMNPQYLNASVLNQVYQNYASNSFIKLAKFLNQEVEESIKGFISRVDSELGGGIAPHGTGVGNGWDTTGPPHLRRYLHACESQSNLSDPETENDAQKLSIKVLEIAEFLASQEFKKWIFLATSFQPVSQKAIPRRFRPGLDYTLATSHAFPTLSANLCLTPAHESWDAGECGGYTSFLEGEDGDAAVYKDGDDDILTFEADWNCLNLVWRDKGVLEFVKYVSAKAVGSRWDISCEFQLQNPSSQ